VKEYLDSHLPIPHGFKPNPAYSNFNGYCYDCGEKKEYVGHRIYNLIIGEETMNRDDREHETNRFDDVRHVDSFVTKDSGQRQEFSTGMVRDVQTDKPRYDLLDLPMLKRWAELMARGAKKYGENNWKKAATEEELNRFKASALRHLFQYLEGDTTEDHAAACYFNLAGAEMVKDKLGKLPVSGYNSEMAKRQLEGKPDCRQG